MIKRSKINNLEKFDMILFFILGVWAIVILFPFYNAFIISVVSPVEYANTKVLLFPKNIVLDSYNYIFSGNKLLIGYRTTLKVLAAGLPINIFLTVCTAYVISRDDFPGRKIFTFLIIFTMFFNGGIIPLYLVVRNLGLTNSLWSVILVSSINTFYLIIVRNYFYSIPKSIEESAKIDGANDIIILFRIILPLTKPILATILLFYAVDRWNEWFLSMLFIRKANVMPLQVILRSIVFTTSSEMSNSATSVQKNVFTDGVKMASIVVTMAPIMMIYPFLQKYFMKGIMIGAVK